MSFITEKIISRKNYFPIVCIVYTLVSLCKIILEFILGIKDPYYEKNFITIFVISLLATFVLALHYYLQNIPLPVVILGQYFLLLGIILFTLWVIGHFIDLHPDGYKDMARSFTIPYIIAAAIYYIRFHLQIKNANKTLEKLKKSGGNYHED